MTQVASAVNDAPCGQVINASEEKVRDVMAEFRRLAYERTVQMRVDETETAFSPGGLGNASLCGRRQVIHGNS